MLKEIYDGQFINPQIITWLFLYLKLLNKFFSIIINTFNAVSHKDMRKN